MFSQATTSALRRIRTKPGAGQQAYQCLHNHLHQAIPKPNVAVLLMINNIMIRRQSRCCPLFRSSSSSGGGGGVRYISTGFMPKGRSGLLSGIGGGLGGHARSRKDRVLIFLGGVTIALILTSGIWLFTTYHAWLEKTVHNYPPPVAKEMRKAIYYHNAHNAKDAISHYKLALLAADQVGMDPLSDEVTGIKIAIAMVLEEFGKFEKSAEVVGHLLGCFLEGVEKSAGGGQGVERNRCLKKAVMCATKIGELYTKCGKLQMAQESLVWSVENALKESKRREVEEVDEEVEGVWFTNEEIGGAVEALADVYEATDQHLFATPLYLHALSVMPKMTCHSVVLMNNISISLSQQPLPPSAPPTATRTQLITDSTTWSQKALEIAHSIPPSEQTSECNTACAVATCNLATFSEMLGRTDEAVRLFKEALRLAEDIEFEEGVAKAMEGIRRVEAGGGESEGEVAVAGGGGVKGAVEEVVKKTGDAVMSGNRKVSQGVKIIEDLAVGEEDGAGNI